MENESPMIDKKTMISRYGKLQGCWIVLLFFPLIYFATSIVGSDLTVGKCCPFGQVFSVEENFTCAYSQDPYRQLHHLKNRSSYKDFSGCWDSENLTITSLGDIFDSVVDAPAACIDLLWDEKINRAIPIVFQCQENEKPLDSKLFETVGEETNLRVPVLTSIRICCHSNTAFDVEKRDCVYHHHDNDVLNYFPFLSDKSDFVSVVRGPPRCDHASIDYVINTTRDLQVLDDGTIKVILPAREHGPFAILANDENSCFDPGSRNEGSNLMVLRICTGSRYCKKNVCVRKCCPENMAMIGDNCDELAAHVHPGRFHEVLINTSAARGTAASVEFMDTLDYGLLIGKPCKYGMFPVEPDEGWLLTKQGQFDLPLYRVYDNDEYCMDIFYESRESSTEQFYPFVCFEENIQLNIEESRLRSGINLYRIFAILEFISCIFLLLTLLVYICLPALQNLHGKTLMCHVASLTVAYAVLATVGLFAPSFFAISNEGSRHCCIFLGFTLLLSWFAAFSWLNVMCFDIWWTFGGLGGAGISGRNGRAYKKRFLVYSLYAWGFPLLVTITGYIIDYTEILPIYLRPNLGSDSCWFERNVNYYGEVIFFIGPVSIQLVANVVFFVLTALYCSKVKAEITRVMAAPSDPRSRRFRSDRTKLIMNVKLFVVMGVSWSLEVISSCFNHYATSIPWRNEFFYVSDFLNCLQGLLIFILFVLKRKVYQALRKRLGKEKETVAASQGGTGLKDPFRVRNSANSSSSTIMSTSGFAASS